MLDAILRETVQTKLSQGQPKNYIRNLLKEVLQMFVLNYIYNSSYGKQFIFTGGSCLRVCYGLPRLSEDIDFDLTSKIDYQKLADNLLVYFKSKLQFNAVEYTICGRFRKIYLKFPILQELGISNLSETNKLYVKLEMTPISSKKFNTEFTPVSKYNVAMLIKHYDLPSLFAGKISAILQRTFLKGKKNEITFKGRDYYDLIWYLEKGVVPNWQRVFEITGIKTKRAVLQSLEKKVERVTARYLEEDLRGLFADANFVKNFSQNFQALYKSYRKTLA